MRAWVHRIPLCARSSPPTVGPDASAVENEEARCNQHPAVAPADLAVGASAAKSCRTFCVSPSQPVPPVRDNWTERAGYHWFPPAAEPGPEAAGGVADGVLDPTGTLLRWNQRLVRWRWAYPGYGDRPRDCDDITTAMVTDLTTAKMWRRKRSWAS
jgi:hypothetical protein